MPLVETLKRAPTAAGNMQLNYRISLWNYFHYHGVGSLERVIAGIRNAGYGVEIWPNWFDEPNLFDPVYRKRLRMLIGDMPSSIHGCGPDTVEHHQQQIDTAAETDSDVIVVHAEHMKLGGASPNFEFAQSILDLAAERGIVLALENGPLAILATALDNLKGLGICLDTGHVYFTPDPLKAFVDRLKQDICHLHIQEKLGSADHYVPGTGDVPLEDWTYLLDSLKAVNFSGAAVLEIRPRDPLLNAQDTKRFFDRLLCGATEQGS